MKDKELIIFLQPSPSFFVVIVACDVTDLNWKSERDILILSLSPLHDSSFLSIGYRGYPLITLTRRHIANTIIQFSY